MSQIAFLKFPVNIYNFTTLSVQTVLFYIKENFSRKDLNIVYKKKFVIIQ